MTREGASLSIDSIQLINSLFALIPIPVAILDDRDRVILTNSSFSDCFPTVKSLSGIPLHEVEVSGQGVFNLEVLPLNDQGMKIVYGVDVSREITLRQQLTRVHSQMTRVFNREAQRGMHDLNEIVRIAVSVWESRQRPVRATFSLDLCADLPDVNVDLSQMERVVSSFVSTAVQSIAATGRRSGSIHIRTWIDGQRVRLSITDNGSGLSFRESRNVHSGQVVWSPDMEYPLGMAACAEIVNDHEGELFSWSTYGSGSTYTVELPIPGKPGGAKSVDEIGLLEGRTILVIDDEIHMTELIRDVLVRHGAEVDLANTDSEAFVAVERRPYELIICDQRMPGITGDQFRRLAESLRPGLLHRFLLVTAEPVDAATRRIFVQAGIEFIQRPFHIEDLIGRVEGLISRDPQSDS